MLMTRVLDGKATMLLVMAAVCVPALVGCGGTNNTSSIPNRTFVYVTDQASNDVSGFSVNPSSGMLSPLFRSPFPTGGHPYAIAIDPHNQFAFVLNDPPALSVFSLNPATGELLPLPSSPLSVSGDNRWVAVHPTGTFVYVCDYQGSPAGIYGWKIDRANNSLVPVPGSPFTSRSRHISFSPGGNFVYSVDFSSVHTLAIDSQTGALTEVGSPASAVAFPLFVSIHPSGKFAYVTYETVSLDFALWEFTIDSTTGALQSVGPVPGFGLIVPAPFAPLVFHPSGKFGYMARGGLYGYAVDQGTGNLTLLSGLPSFSAQPLAIAIDTSGKYAYVANGTLDNVSVFAINSDTGALSLVQGSSTTPFPSAIATTH